MKSEEIAKLRKTIEDEEQLEGLSVLGNILDGIVSDIEKTPIKGNLESLSESVKHQKAIYNKAMLLYESMQASDTSKEEKINILKDFEESLQDYYTFSDSLVKVD